MNIVILFISSDVLYNRAIEYLLEWWCHLSMDFKQSLTEIFIFLVNVNVDVNTFVVIVM